MYKVVIVDDEEIIVEGLCRAFPWEKYSCTIAGTALNGHDGLKLVESKKPDILFTDIHMPGLNGLAMIAALKSEFPNLQIIILSGYSDFDYAQQAIRLGVCRYLNKPSKMAELEESMQAVINNLQLAASKLGNENNGEIQEEYFNEKDEAASNFIIKNAVKYIEENYTGEVSLPDVAENVYVSQWHLSKLIARNMGCSFSELLNRVRIDKAKELLADHSLRVWEVSEMVGFNDVTHFSRIFKKMENQSPNDYRNNL